MLKTKFRIRASFLISSFPLFVEDGSWRRETTWRNPAILYYQDRGTPGIISIHEQYIVIHFYSFLSICAVVYI